jgi:hypothetical protein
MTVRVAPAFNAAFVHVCHKCVRKTVIQDIFSACVLGFWSAARYVLKSCDDVNHKGTKDTKDNRELQLSRFSHFSDACLYS